MPVKLEKKLPTSWMALASAEV
eukprot:COSAG01_NODE_22470_length_854_cov_1.699338_2_plen_21_part_01